MLSRVANSLYWMSRYIERAENIARLLDVNMQLLLDFRDIGSAQLAEHWQSLLQSTGDEADFFAKHKKASGKAVAEFLVFEASNPNSIISSVCQARENARMIRDQITIELWEELNNLYLFVRSPQAHEVWRQSPSEFFQKVKDASLHLGGISYATLPRNEGWWFSEAGRYMERADKTSRILDLRHQSLSLPASQKFSPQTEALEWTAILRSCSAWDAYKAVHGEVHPMVAAEFLLLSEDFPRSARFCVSALNHALRSLSGVAEGRFSNDAEKLAGRLVAELQFSSIGEICQQGIHGYIDCLQTKLNAIGDALFKTYINQVFQTQDEELFVQQEEQQQQVQ